MIAFPITPFTVFRTLVILVCGVAFLRVLMSHPAGIIAFGIASMVFFAFLLYDAHLVALALVRFLAGA
jgi:hypothetical protein